jgi:hypothetical protein
MGIQKMCVLLTVLLLVSLSVNLQNCQAVSAPEHTSALFQSFLTDVMGVNLTEYNITKPGYGTSYPSNFGGKVKEETISYQLVSGHGMLSTWCLIGDGAMSTCSLSSVEGETFFAHPVNIKDSLNSFMQKYQAFVSHNSQQKDTAYLSLAMSMVDGLDFQTATEKTVGNMKLTVNPTIYETTIKWAYAYEGVDLVRKAFSVDFTNGHVSWFSDTWNLYSVYNQTMVSQEEAQPIAFEAAQAKTINMFSVESSQPTAVQVTPDWTNWTCKANLNLIPGAESSQAIGLSNDTYVDNGRDPLMLYPLWHFIFYFSSPINNVLGVEVGVWADNGEVSYSNIYGVLGPSVTGAPESTDAAQSAAAETSMSASQSPQLSGETKNDFTLTQSEYLIAAVVGVIVATTVGGLVTVRKRRNVDQRMG